MIGFDSCKEAWIDGGFQRVLVLMDDSGELYEDLPMLLFVCYGWNRTNMHKANDKLRYVVIYTV